MDKEFLTGWTTIEQSKALVEAGLNPDTADMYYSAYITYANGKPIKEKPEYGLQAWPYKDRSSMIVGFTKVDYVPCWTLGKLIDSMPRKPFISENTGDWFVQFDTDHEHEQQFSNKILINAVYEAFKWLLENGYGKVEKKG